MNKDLERERKRCSFDVEDMSKWWFGGAEQLKEKRELEKYFFDDPESANDIPDAYRSHKELYEVSVRKATNLFSKILPKLQAKGSTNIDYLDELNKITELTGGMFGMSKEGNPLGVHFGMFFPTILGQGNDEQKAYWIERAWKMQILGTYAQTELGHGTFVRGLQTTATYDPKTQEFIMNTPSLNAYKWWPGGLGHSSNYAVVIAQLYTNGENHGVHPFMVQLRDDNTWQPLKGIHIGEIGPKMGMKAVNNGFLGFDNVRLPRLSMLMGNSKVLPDGTYIKSPASVLTYGTLIFVRVAIVSDMAAYLSLASTIATRYSAVRRQSPIDPTKPEPQVIDHITQQLKLFPNIARAVVFKLVAKSLRDMYDVVRVEITKGNLDRLNEMHAMSCGLKSVSTTDAAQGIEILRMSCGGHGYMDCSNLPSAYGMVMAACTYDGENTVMLLQTARFLIKSWGKIVKNEQLGPTVAYLALAMKNEKLQWNSSMLGICQALEFIAGRKIRTAYENVDRRKKQQGHSHEQAVNLTSIELVQAADAHLRAYMVKLSYEKTKNINTKVPSALATTISQLIELYAIETISKYQSDLLRITTFGESDIQELQIRLENLLTKIRPNAVGIVDGFDFPDSRLESALGAYDGNVYEHIFAQAEKSPLNQTPVPGSHEKFLRPYMKSKI